MLISTQVAFVKKHLKEARKLSKTTIKNRLGEAGLAWLRRRRKTLVTEAHKAARLKWADWVLSRTVATLSRWAYTDGTVFYLARDMTEQSSTVRSALGPSLWRQADGSDALYEDCVGPSAYWKAQGLPVRIWGLLAAGKFFVHVLPEGETMNRWYYAWLLETVFPRWLTAAFGDRYSKVYLLQDHEKALWTAEPRAAMTTASLNLLENYPKCSQDLNPIENMWRELRERLSATLPEARESRKEFIQRLRNAVAWVNANRSEYMLHICTSQKERAHDVKSAVPPGARTKH